MPGSERRSLLAVSEHRPCGAIHRGTLPLCCRSSAAGTGACRFMADLLAQNSPRLRRLDQIAGVHNLDKSRQSRILRPIQQRGLGSREPKGRGGA